MSGDAPTRHVHPVRMLVILLCGGGLLYGVLTLARNSTPQPVLASAAEATALLSYAATGDVINLRAELKRGANVDIRQRGVSLEQGMTPLMYAAKSGSLDAVNALLTAKANPNIAADDGKTALMIATLSENPAIVRVLIDNGARVDARTQDNWTALMFAAARGRIEALNALIQAGATIEDRNRARQSALMIATRSGNIEAIRRLLETGASVDAADADGMTALNTAADAVDDVEVLSRLIAAGAKVNTADNEGVTPLMRAAARGKPDFVATRVKAGADVDAKARRGWTASQWANNRGDDFGRE
ncbi:MAG: ankyrin repeat domain-containing protein, partial [Planctomyces sp.]